MKTRLVILLGIGVLAIGASYGEEMDFGDAPEPIYPTLLPAGARHRASPLWLGAGVDYESNGQPIDRDGGDEAGVAIPPLVIGSSVTLLITSSAGGLLNAWLDYDGIAGWSSGEQVFTNLPVTVGTHPYPLNIPAIAVPGPSWLRFRVSTTGGLAPGGPAIDGEVEDYRVSLVRPLDPSPILFVLDYHADPMGGSNAIQEATFGAWVDASHWLLDQTESRGAKASFLTVGGFAEWARAKPDMGFPLLQRLYASGGQIGTHSHREYHRDLHEWPDLSSSASLEQLTNAWNDHLNMVDALISESLGFTAPADIRRINFVRGSHVPSDHQQRFDFMAMSGYTQHEQGPDETFYDYFGHFAMNPYRPSGTNFLAHDAGGPVVLAPLGSVLGKNETHSSDTVLDMRLPAVKARVLLEVLNWLHDREIAGTGRVWVSGWGQHCTDILPRGATYTNLVPMLDWLNEHVIGQPVGGQVAGNWASMGDAGNAYRNWEAAHPGATSFNYSPTNTDWNQYPYLRPAAAYLAEADYVASMPPVSAVRWHSVTVNPDSATPFTAYVAYTTNGVPVDADLSAHLTSTSIAAVNPANGHVTVVSSASVPIPPGGTILVPTNHVMRLRLDFGDAPGPYPVLITSDGARHAPSSLRLGSAEDTEWDGRPSATADGDDLADAPSDEDGVTLPTSMRIGVTNEVTVVMTGAAEAILDAWFDWNHDSVWSASEHYRVRVETGLNRWKLRVPTASVSGQTFARFRVSSAGTLLPTGLAADGEVEDYPVQLSTFVPTIAVTTSISGGLMQVTWDAVAGDVLESAESITGPWAEVSGATSPYSVAPLGEHKFYRVRLGVAR
jgi:hypothetical protein